MGSELPGMGALDAQQRTEIGHPWRCLREKKDAMHVKIQTVRSRTWEMRDGEKTKKSGWIRRKQRSRGTESFAISRWRPISAGFAGSSCVRLSCSGDHAFHAIPAPSCLSPTRPVRRPLRAKYFCARIQLGGPRDTASNGKASKGSVPSCTLLGQCSDDR